MKNVQITTIGIIVSSLLLASIGTSIWTTRNISKRLVSLEQRFDAADTLTTQELAKPFTEMEGSPANVVTAENVELHRYVTEFMTTPYEVRIVHGFNFYSVGDTVWTYRDTIAGYGKDLEVTQKQRILKYLGKD